MLPTHRHTRDMLWLFHPETEQDGQSFGRLDKLDSLLSFAFGKAEADDFECIFAQLWSSDDYLKHHLVAACLLEHTSILLDRVINEENSQSIKHILNCVKTRVNELFKV